MKRFNALLSFLMMVGLVAAAPVFGAEMNQNGPSMMHQPQNHNEMMNQSQNPEEMSRSPFSHPIDLSYLMHKTVRNEQGRKIGEVSDVVVGPNGQAQFVIIERAGLFRTSGKYIPVPWKTFTSNWKNVAQLNQSRPIVLSLAESRLNQAPNFSSKKDLTNSATRQRVCQYFKGDCAQDASNHGSTS